jgi:hypothetical protein
LTSTLAFWTAHFCVHTCNNNKKKRKEKIFRKVMLKGRIHSTTTAARSGSGRLLVLKSDNRVVTNLFTWKICYTVRTTVCSNKRLYNLHFGTRMTECILFKIFCMTYIIFSTHDSFLQIYNIRTLSVNIKFICTSFSKSDKFSDFFDIAG